MKPVVETEFTAVFERASVTGARLTKRAASTMELFLTPKEFRSGYIGWDIPGIDRYDEINLWWDEHKRLTRFDGVPFLPIQAANLLEAYGIRNISLFMKPPATELPSTFRLAGVKNA